MHQISEQAAVELIVAAVKSKYSHYPSERLKLFCESEWSKIRKMNLPELSAAIKSVEDAESDIRNQLITLCLLEQRKLTESNLVGALHKNLFDSGDQRYLRETDSLPDFNEKIRVSYLDVEARLQELEIILSSFATFLIDERREVQVRFLAFVFSSVIRIHPFIDGNGRVARMLVQQLQIWWGKPLLLIPKVRNDGVWKRAIIEAVDGDLELLVKCIAEAQELI